jgi:2OG-Fe(II) oxygenase superfamily
MVLTETATIEQVRLETAPLTRRGHTDRTTSERELIEETRAFERLARALDAENRQADDAETPYFFDPEVLLPLAEENSTGFASATPFPHVVFDGLLPSELLERVISEVPEPGDGRWFSHKSGRAHRKQAIASDWKLGEQTRHLLGQLNSSVFIDFLERLSGIPGLIPDPHHEGGGLQQIGSGGFLKIHTDVPFHRTWKIDRQLNVLLYLNKDWDESWGGDFEMWRDDMSSHDSVSPLFNRMVIFATPNAKHGHPDPLGCPEGTFRRALVTHYYTSTSVAHTRLGDSPRHYARPGEVLSQESKIGTEAVRTSRARDFLPPLLVRGASRLRRRVAQNA